MSQLKSVSARILLRALREVRHKLIRRKFYALHLTIPHFPRLFSASAVSQSSGTSRTVLGAVQIRWIMESFMLVSFRNPLCNFFSTLFCPFWHRGTPLCCRREKHIPMARFSIYNVNHKRTQRVAVPFFIDPTTADASTAKIPFFRKSYGTSYSYLEEARNDKHRHNCQHYRQENTKDNCHRWDYGHPNKSLPRSAFEPARHFWTTYLSTWAVASTTSAECPYRRSR
jgi:hypothetical protein